MEHLKNMSGVDERDQKMIEDAERMLGPEPQQMGFVKNLFWGRVRDDLLSPFPQPDDLERRRCDTLLLCLEQYLSQEHPSIEIDRDQEIPPWVIERLFDLGVMGMTIPTEFGGLGLGLTSYTRVLSRIGATCAATSVMVSTHLSIGCRAIMDFGTDNQQQQWLPHLATHMLSAFCLSEPNVGCDAGGQETRCEPSADGTHFIVNGEKKWATSGALSGMFTVTAKQTFVDPDSGETSEGVTALICTPHMPGVEIFEANRSKCGIRGTWQARIRFTNVKVPRENLLHQEGKGLSVALKCLNIGRCTLSAGVAGAAERCAEQAIKWTSTRHQFGRPLADFELVRQRIGRITAMNYAMEAMLQMTTGMLERGDEDIMLETAVCKVFCSEMAWRVINDSMQIMGGEAFMTENEMERAMRDSRIYLIVEGANEVMQAFIFAYGGKQLAEHMLELQAMAGGPDCTLSERLSNCLRLGRRPALVGRGLRLAAELFLGLRRRRPQLHGLSPELAGHGKRFCRLVREHSHQFKLAGKKYREAIVRRQAVQARVADTAMWLHAMACVLSRLDRQLRSGATGVEAARDQAAARHFLELAELEIVRLFKEHQANADDSMQAAADAAIAYNDTLPNSDFIIPEHSPTAAGSGRCPDQSGIPQFARARTADGSQLKRCS
ncbi:MAG: acyl-CoA dehydrogenase family protein [Lentisphaeria bacterium]|jgi:alkylation response protein AidB-like acyl-CoA dehydrogenase|nr:acyl-CoA dehydrogenase family protein [Lentisphaeria bacterium]MDP7743449.1 acyl-CoA dehydrogenase family protein [Lentisphaeria bacterium]